MLNKRSLSRTRTTAFLALAVMLLSTVSSAQFPLPPRPKLVLFIAIDQFRYDYLTRFRSEYTGGLKTLLDRGAIFANANLEHYPTVTAIGHSTMLTGATPSISGIVGNDWFDRKSGKSVTSVSDETTKLLGGGDRTGSSPRRLLVSTVGDELKRSNLSVTPKVFGLSLKDRSAILPAGHMADGAFWYSSDTGEFVSSTYYYKDLPEWAQKFNQEKHPEKFAGKVWISGTNGNTERKLMEKPGPMLYSGVYSSPYGNDMLALFAERALIAEKLGHRGTTDLLSVSFSSNDAVGHAFGPDSVEAHTISLNVDKALGHLLNAVDKHIGLDNVVIALTADHAVSPKPEVLEEQNMPGGRLKGNFFAPMQEALEKKFGAGKWILSTAGSSPYLNYELIAEKNLLPAEVRKVAAESITNHPNVFRVYTRDQILNGRSAIDRIDERVFRGFNAKNSGDLEVILNPYWIRGTTAATHGSPFNYDTHIPLVLMGKSIRPGFYYQHAAQNDLAPTLAALLSVEIPSGSMGRILHEAFQPVSVSPSQKKK